MEGYYEIKNYSVVINNQIEIRQKIVYYNLNMLEFTAFRYYGTQEEILPGYIQKS